MSYFTKIGNSISVKSKEIVRNAKAASETNSLANIIKSEQQKIEVNYRNIGRLYYQKFGSRPDEEFEEYIAAVKDSITKINEVNDEIVKIKNRNCCPNCGTKFITGSKFCSKCGAKVQEDLNETDLPKCSNCGNVIVQGALFCDSCGAKINNGQEFYYKGFVEQPNAAGPSVGKAVSGAGVNSRVGSPHNNVNRTVPNAAPVQDNIGGVAPNVSPVPDNIGGVAPNVSPVPDNIGGVAPNVSPVPDNIGGVVPNVSPAPDNINKAEPDTAPVQNTGAVNRFCPSCGAEQDDESLFCIECGTKL